MNVFYESNPTKIWNLLLSCLSACVSKNLLNMNVIVNRKQVKNKAVLQFETAVGDALNFFPDAVGMNVPRSRFLPVKRTGDLLLLQSNFFNIERGLLKRASQTEGLGLPRINLKPPFDDLKEYQKRIPVAPDIKKLNSL